MKKVRINTVQRIKLYEWLKINATQEKLTASRSSIEQVTAAASHAMGFPISPVSVGELLNSLGVRTVQGGKLNGHTANEIRSRLDAVESQLRTLFAKLGEPLPS